MTTGLKEAILGDNRIEGGNPGASQPLAKKSVLQFSTEELKKNSGKNPDLGAGWAGGFYAGRVAR